MSQPVDTMLGLPIANRYQILRKEGEEELGRVYVAKDLETRELVSVKVLRPHLTGDPEVFGRFGREMMATAAINHPNTVKLLDFGEHSVMHFLVLEYMSARTLEEAMEGGRKLQPERAIHIAAQIASALAAAHKERIVHRNLSPANVLLLRNVASHDYVKVRDFGLARLQAPDSDDGGLTQANVRVGTFAFMAPEYIEFGQVAPSGDVYALGCILYYMLTGEPPFTGKNHEIMEKHILEEPVPPSSKVRGIKPWLNELVLHMLKKRPDQRPADAQEVVEILEAKSGFDLSPPKLVAIDQVNEAAGATPAYAGSSAGRRSAKMGGAIVGASMFFILGLAVLLFGGLLILLGTLFLS